MKHFTVSEYLRRRTGGLWPSNDFVIPNNRCDSINIKNNMKNNTSVSVDVSGGASVSKGVRGERRSRSSSLQNDWNVTDSDSENVSSAKPKKHKQNNNQNSTDMETDEPASNAGNSERNLMPPPGAPLNLSPLLALSNRFDRLSDRNVEAKRQSTSKNNGAKNNRSSGASGSSSHTNPINSTVTASGQKVPVITVTQPPTKEMYDVIDKLSKDHTFYSRSGELKIFPSSAEYHRCITAKLIEMKVPFFTHPLKGEPRFRSVLYGIPHMPIATIVAQLLEHNIVPVSVEYLLTKEEREKNVSTAALAGLESNRLRSYVLEFSSVTVKRDQVHNIKYVNHHICSWRIFKSGGNGPTICNRCCMFGHGQRCCGRAAVCSRCAEAHSTSDCPLSPGKNGRMKFKCINCITNELDSKHCATSPDCPSRELYTSRRRQANEARNKKSASSNSSHVVTPRHVPRSNGPPLKQATGTSRARTPHRAATMSKSYAEAISGARSRATPSQSKSHSQSIFSLDECADLLFSAIEDLQSCQSKLDQLKVIAGLLQKCLV